MTDMTNEALAEAALEAIWDGLRMPCQTRSIIEAARRLRAMSWRPISEAPKDGEPILAFYPHYYVESVKDRRGITVIEWWGEDDGWHTLDGDAFGEPTHFMPLPQPPEPTDD